MKQQTDDRLIDVNQHQLIPGSVSVSVAVGSVLHPSYTCRADLQEMQPQCVKIAAGTCWGAEVEGREKMQDMVGYMKDRL